MYIQCTLDQKVHVNWRWPLSRLTFILMMVFSAQLACFSPFILYFYPLYSSYVAPSPPLQQDQREIATCTVAYCPSPPLLSGMQLDQRGLRRITVDGCFTHQFRAFINHTVWEGFTCISIAILLTIFKYILISCSYTYSQVYS